MQMKGSCSWHPQPHRCPLRIVRVRLTRSCPLRGRAEPTRPRPVKARAWKEPPYAQAATLPLINHREPDIFCSRAMVTLAGSKTSQFNNRGRSQNTLRFQPPALQRTSNQDTTCFQPQAYRSLSQFPCERFINSKHYISVF